MFISLNWLKDFVKIPSSITSEELGLRLTMHTVEIDGVEKHADKFRNIIVGKILEIKKHPNADRLQIAKIDVGKERMMDVVCGASNIEIGQMVPVAIMGAKLPNGLEINETEIRGVKSCGMICAEDELELGDDHSGIIVLEKDAKIGQNLGEFLKLNDTIFEVDNKSITNRPDLWGHYGMAREISAFLKVELKKLKVGLKCLQKITDKKINIKIEKPELCKRYMAIEMSGIEIAPSPKWMQKRLIAVGMKPINNIVDITNFVMLELGQPLHAFDKNLVDKIVVRQAKKGETIETLDKEKKELDKDILVIANSKKPLAVAGVIGGIDSGITEKTDSIIIESANFDFLTIRKASQKIGTRTESSMRFEKGFDPNLCEIAIARAVELTKQICPQAKIASDLADKKQFKKDKKIIELDLEWLNKKIGDNISEKKIVKILTSLGFKIKKDQKNILAVEIPSWRAGRDITIPEDLVEEIVRIYGYDNLELNMPMAEIKSSVIHKEQILEQKIKNILIGSPILSEVYNYSFVGEEQLAKLGIGFSNYIKLANPISNLQTMLRQNLTVNLLENIKINQAKFNEIRLFEIGSVYFSEDGDIYKDSKNRKKLPREEKILGIVLVGGKNNSLFKEMKGIVEYLAENFDLEINFKQAKNIKDWEDEKFASLIKIGKTEIGSINILKTAAAKKIGIKKEVVFAEIILKNFFSEIEKTVSKKYKPREKYPSVVRDLAFVIDVKMSYSEIREEILEFNKEIRNVELFDEFVNGKLGDNKKSLAFHIVYQAGRTLISKEVDNLQKKLVNHLRDKFKAEIRDF